jgi:membrane-associated PAP2 superfamily phosphatase
MQRDTSVGKTLLMWWMILALLTLLWDASGLDLVVSTWFGNAQGFALREDVVWGRGMYQLQRVLGWAVVATLLWLTLQPHGAWLMLPKSQRWAMLITVLIVVGLIPLLKKVNGTSCPWDLAQFGGAAKAQWVSHWNWGVMDTGARHCFPAGHSSTAFGFFAVPVFLLAVSRPWALRLLALVVAAGVWMGFTQVYRGAHFVSHSLWTAWISLSLASVAWVLTKRAASAQGFRP